MIDDPADLAALRALPLRLTATGYVDALALRGLMSLTADASTDLELLPPDLRAMVELWFLRREVERARVETVLATTAIEALVRLGILVARDQALSTMHLVALPVLGTIVLVPSPTAVPGAYFGDDVALLTARMNAYGRTLILGAGPGALATHAARSASQVLAIDADPIAAACAELNVAMHGLTNVELRTADLLAPLAGEFDRVIVAAPTLPFLTGTEDRTGPYVLGEVVRRLPAWLGERGIAQLAGVWLGDADGPILPPSITETATKLHVAVTLSSRQPIGPGSALFEALVGRLSRTAPDPPATARRFERFLVDRRATHVFLTAITASRWASPGLAISQHWTRGGGAWTRRDRA